MGTFTSKWVLCALSPVSTSKAAVSLKFLQIIFTGTNVCEAEFLLLCAACKKKISDLARPKLKVKMANMNALSA